MARMLWLMQKEETSHNHVYVCLFDVNVEMQ